MSRRESGETPLPEVDDNIFNLPARQLNSPQLDDVSVGDPQGVPVISDETLMRVAEAAEAAEFDVPILEPVELPDGDNIHPMGPSTTLPTNSLARIKLATGGTSYEHTAPTDIVDRMAENKFVAYLDNLLQAEKLQELDNYKLGSYFSFAKPIDGILVLHGEKLYQITVIKRDENDPRHTLHCMIRVYDQTDISDGHLITSRSTLKGELKFESADVINLFIDIPPRQTAGIATTFRKRAQLNLVGEQCYLDRTK